jgi:hypothetical protein
MPSDIIHSASVYLLGAFPYIYIYSDWVADFGAAASKLSEEARPGWDPTQEFVVPAVVGVCDWVADFGATASQLSKEARTGWDPTQEFVVPAGASVSDWAADFGASAAELSKEARHGWDPTHEFVVPVGASAELSREARHGWDPTQEFVVPVGASEQQEEKQELQLNIEEFQLFRWLPKPMFDNQGLLADMAVEKLVELLQCKKGTNVEEFKLFRWLPKPRFENTGLPTDLAEEQFVQVELLPQVRGRNARRKVKIEEEMEKAEVARGLRLAEAVLVLQATRLAGFGDLVEVGSDGAICIGGIFLAFAAEMPGGCS